MSTTYSSLHNEVAFLKAQLALAQTRLERAEVFVFDLRCLAAKGGGRSLWIREGDESSLREAYEGSAGLGGWKELDVRVELQLALPASLALLDCVIPPELQPTFTSSLATPG
jgi:hypothetical protein